MNKKLREKILESLSAVLPITCIVLLLSVTVVPMPISTLALFLGGAMLLIVGMGFFSLGAEISMMPMGEKMGEEMTGARRLWLVLVLVFFIGAIITVAEPDLKVLANQVPGIPNLMLVLTVALGVGIFLVLAMLRARLRIRLSHMLVGCYGATLVLTAFVPKDFLSVAFDAGGVTTGPITVPFILALGIGMGAIRNEGDAGEDSFGLIALCSVGPILSVLILGIFYQSTGSYIPVRVPAPDTTRELFITFASGSPVYIEEVLLALLPIALFFLIFQLIRARYHGRKLLRVWVGFVYTLLGLILFLTGVNIGFMPAGHFIGAQIAELSYLEAIVPLGMVMGFFLVKAEPAVLVLNKQVEEISGGIISQKAMMMSLSVGVACAVGLAMLRLLTGISILWIIIPGYTIALILTRFTPKIFTAIAFDSGGVASGPMATTFLLPFAIGACESLGGNIVQDAFGVIAMVALTPLLTIQLLGMAWKFRKKAVPVVDLAGEGFADEIIEYEEEVSSDAK